VASRLRPPFTSPLLPDRATEVRVAARRLSALPFF
jgi:hypothetical protein